MTAGNSRPLLSKDKRKVDALFNELLDKKEIKYGILNNMMLMMKPNFNKLNSNRFSDSRMKTTSHFKDLATMSRNFKVTNQADFKPESKIGNLM